MGHRRIIRKKISLRVAILILLLACGISVVVTISLQYFIHSLGRKYLIVEYKPVGKKKPVIEHYIIKDYSFKADDFGEVFLSAIEQLKTEDIMKTKHVSEQVARVIARKQIEKEKNSPFFLVFKKDNSEADKSMGLNITASYTVGSKRYENQSVEMWKSICASEINDVTIIPLSMLEQAFDRAIKFVDITNGIDIYPRRTNESKIKWSQARQLR